MAFTSVDGPGGRNTLGAMTSLSAAVGTVGTGNILGQSLPNFSQSSSNPALVSSYYRDSSHVHCFCLY